MSTRSHGSASAGHRIDTKALAAELPDVAERYSIPTVSRRFCVA